MIPFDLPPKPKLWVPPKPGIIRATSLKEIELFQRKSKKFNIALPILGSFGAMSQKGFKGSAGATYEIAIPKLLGTPIGNMSSMDGLASAFDSNYATNSGIANTDTGYTGMSFNSGHKISKVTLRGNSTLGFFEARTTVALTLYGKNGAPSSGTDGTSLATTSISDTNTDVTLTVSSPTTTYTHVWVYISGSGGGLGHEYIAEIQFYEQSDTATVSFSTTGPTPGTTDSGSYTLVDRAILIPNGTVITQLGLYCTNSPTAVKLKIVKENSSSNYDTVSDNSVSPGTGGWQDFTLGSPYTVPSSGTYRMAIYWSGTCNIYNSSARSYASGDQTGTGWGATASTNQMACLRATGYYS